MRFTQALLLPGILTVAVLLAGPRSVEADTVYLKNGNWIDGTVGYRSDVWIELQVGDIGRMKIALEDIYLIEKNKRTGGEAILKGYVGGQGQKEEVDPDDVEGSDEESDDDGPSSGKEDGDESSRTSDPDEGDPGDSGSDAEPGEDDLEEARALLGGEEEEISPELKKKIEGLVQDLQRQKSRYRVRAERQLKAVGRPAIPYLVPVLRKRDKSSDLTRIAVMRLFHSFGDDRVIEPCIDSLNDRNEYVRQYANKALIRITGENFGFQPSASPRRRELVQKKWAKWWKSELEELARNHRESQKSGDSDEEN